MGVGLGHVGVLEPVGYWPAFLFNLQTDYAARVEWGGEITNKHTYGRHTTTQMGSGYLPDSGFGKAAYICNIEVALSENDFQPLQNLTVGGSHPDYYRAKKSNNPELGTHFYYGGPEQLYPGHATAIHLTWDSSLLYYVSACYCLFSLLSCDLKWYLEKTWQCLDFVLANA